MKLEERVSNIGNTITELSKNIKLYKQTDSSNVMLHENIKKEVIELLDTLSTHYGYFLSSIEDLKEDRKLKKAQAIEKMLEEGIKVTTVKELVYTNEDFKKFNVEYREVLKIYNRIKVKYDIYTTTFSSILQTVSVGKEGEKRVS